MIWQATPMQYKVRSTNRTIEEEVLPNNRTRAKAGASLGTMRYAIIARLLDTLGLITMCSSSKMPKLRELIIRATDNGRPNILLIKNSVKSKVLVTTQESSTWLLDSDVSYHVTPHRSQFRQYSTQYSDSVRVRNVGQRPEYERQLGDKWEEESITY